MRKTAFLILIIIFASTAYASEDGRTKHGKLAREGIVLDRGVLNVLGLPVEILKTPFTERKMHKWIWPVTFIPRAFTNTMARATSIVYDILVYPWVVPFTDDLSPLTEPMGLPEYAWSRS